jgi:hypothetical protein
MASSATWWRSFASSAYPKCAGADGPHRPPSCCPTPCALHSASWQRQVAEAYATCLPSVGHGLQEGMQCAASALSLAPHPSRLQGRIRQDQSGFASFEVEYGCLVCRPYRGEVMDVVVTAVNKVSSDGGPGC